MTSIQQRDVQSVLGAIDDLLPQIRERAQATEDLRRIPDETIQALDEVGFFTLLQPEQWGGLQCDPTLFYEATRRLASACGSRLMSPTTRLRATSVRWTCSARQARRPPPGENSSAGC